MTRHIIEISEESPAFGTTVSAFTTFGYSAAVRSHGHLFIAGTIGRRPDGTIPEDIGEQTEICLRKIKEILRLEGLDLSALVDVTSYHVDIQKHLAGFVEAKSRLIAAPFPAWTIIGVSALAVPGLLVEIRSVAGCPDGE